MKERFRFVFISVFILHFSGLHAQEKVSTKASNVSILEKEFEVKSLEVSHKIWVYLPPNYENSSKKFPVIYMHDAQNLFDNATSYAGEWGIDETLNNLFKKTGKGFIVVGIENSGDQRIDEYTPFKNEKYGGGKGDFYIDFLVKELKPYIDTNFRTKPDAKNTAIIGSSLGGLISFYGGLKYPKVFGKIGAFSTSFWFSDEIYSFAKENGNHKNLKIYFLVGEKEGEEMVRDTEKMIKALSETGFPSKNMKLKIVPEGKHNEAFWKSEFLETLNFLFKI